MLVRVDEIIIPEGRRPLVPEKVRGLADSIVQVGLLNPITIKADRTLVAGLHRLAAYRTLGLAEIECTVADLAGLYFELAEIDENLMRADLTKFQESVHFARRKVIYEELHPETKQGGAPGLPGGGKAKVDNLSGFAQDAADKTDKSERTIRRRTALGERLEMFADLIAGTPIEDNQSELQKLAALDNAKIVDVLEKICTGQADSVTQAKTQIRRQERVDRIQDISQGNSELDTSKRYPVIYADPPWRYEHVKTDSRAIENQYPTMTLDDICALPVCDLAASDAVLFLWATSPKLAEAMRVIEAWGFTYRTCMVWEKDKIGMGYYARQKHELLLIAARGQLPVPKPEHRPPSVITSPRLEHSAKPVRFYEIIERMYPEYAKQELFSRQTREGWVSWGNQA